MALNDRTEPNIFIKNNYRQQLINFLKINFKKEFLSNDHLIRTDFNIENNKNSLTEVIAIGGKRLYVGQFSGRSGSWIELKDNHGAFVFVNDGAFEVENRLLLPKDSLALWDTESVEFEALSENAILLIITL